MANESLWIGFVAFLVLFAILILVFSRQQTTATKVAPTSHYIIIPPRPEIAETTPTIYKLVSPSPGADIESILSYLLERGHALDGTPWSSEVRTALRTRTAWQPSGGSPPSYFYPSGLNTQSSFLLYYDDASNTWSIRPGR
jgi:hypothetical protein